MDEDSHDEEEEDVMGLLFAADASDKDFTPVLRVGKGAKARAERSLRTASLTRRRSSALLQQEFRGRGSENCFLMKLNLNIGPRRHRR